MSEECTSNCKTCNKDCGDRKSDFMVEANELSSIKKVIGIISGKGGVGKSLVTSTLAAAIGKEGRKAAILDADITGPSIPSFFGIKGKAEANELGIFPFTSKIGVKIISLNLLLEHNTDPVVWRGPVIASTVKQFWSDVIWDDVDFMFVDMPPGTGDVPLTVFQSLPVDGLIVVSSPQELVGLIVEKAVKMANMMNVPILAFVENMSYFKCDNCDKTHYLFGESKIDDFAERYGVDTVAKIPLDPEVAHLCDIGKVEHVNIPALDGVVNKLLSME